LNSHSSTIPAHQDFSSAERLSQRIALAIFRRSSFVNEHGRVKKVLFEPDQDERVRGQIDRLLDRIAREKWGDL